jgi:hypothetical protein
MGAIDNLFGPAHPDDRDFPISELRIVKMYIRNPGQEPDEREPQVRYMHKDQVDTFVNAAIELHHVRGNPHIPAKLDNLWRITVEGLATRTVTYWWCTDGLHDNGAGARLNDHVIHAPTRKEVFAHPDLVAARRKEWQEDMRAEREQS